MGRLTLPLESHWLPQLPSVVTNHSQPGLPSGTHQTDQGLCHWLLTMTKDTESGGTVPRQAMPTLQRSPLCVAKPTAHTLNTLGTTPSTCLLLHVRQGWPQMYLRLGRKDWFTFRYQTIPDNENNKTSMILSLFFRSFPSRLVYKFLTVFSGSSSDLPGIMRVKQMYYSLPDMSQIIFKDKEPQKALGWKKPLSTEP